MFVIDGTGNCQMTASGAASAENFVYITKTQYDGGKLLQWKTIIVHCKSWVPFTVILTNFYAVNDENFVQMGIFTFECLLWFIMVVY